MVLVIVDNVDHSYQVVLRMSFHVFFRVTGRIVSVEQLLFEELAVNGLSASADELRVVCMDNVTRNGPFLVKNLVESGALVMQWFAMNGPNAFLTCN